MLNGVDSLIMMKADVLNTFAKISVCSKYKINGQVKDEFPFDLSNETLEPVYQEMNGWNTRLGGIDSFDALPAPLSEYIRLIEKETGVPVEMVSIGPDRVQTLKQ
jgi:adenylosuccinate synthase